MPKGITNKPRKGWKLSESTKRKQSLALMGNQNGIGNKNRLGKTLTEESRKKISRSLIGNTRTLGWKPSEEQRKRLSESHMGSSRKGRRGWSPSAETRSKISRANKDQPHPWQVGDLNVMNRPEVLEKAVQNNMRSRRRNKQNGAERRLENVLNVSFPGVWRFVGNGGLMIGGLCPDFSNGDHKIIEMFGDYWHKNKGSIPYSQTEKGRLEHFAKHGYETLVIWESELSDVGAVNRRVGEFSCSLKIGGRVV